MTAPDPSADEDLFLLRLIEAEDAFDADDTFSQDFEPHPTIHTFQL